MSTPRPTKNPPKPGPSPIPVCDVVPTAGGDMTPAAPQSLDVTAPNEAAAAFLAEIKGPRETPTLIPIIKISHDDHAFILPSGELAPTVSGYPVYYFQTRRFYKQAFKGGSKGTPPDCWSGNMQEPHISSLEKQASSCAECPMNQFGTARDGRGKACAAYTWVFLLNPKFGTPPLGVLIAPPSSIRALLGTRFESGYFAKAAARNSGVYELTWTTFGLTKQEGEKHCVLEPRMGNNATDPHRVKRIAEVRNEFIAKMDGFRATAIDVGDEGGEE